MHDVPPRPPHIKAAFPRIVIAESVDQGIHNTTRQVFVIQRVVRFSHGRCGQSTPIAQPNFGWKHWTGSAAPVGSGVRLLAALRTVAWPEPLRHPVGIFNLLTGVGVFLGQGAAPLSRQTLLFTKEQ